MLAFIALCAQYCTFILFLLAGLACKRKQQETQSKNTAGVNLTHHSLSTVQASNEVYLINIFFFLFFLLLFREIKEFLGKQGMPLKTLSFWSLPSSFSFCRMILIPTTAFHYCDLPCKNSQMFTRNPYTQMTIMQILRQTRNEYMELLHKTLRRFLHVNRWRFISVIANNKDESFLISTFPPDWLVRCSWRGWDEGSRQPSSQMCSCLIDSMSAHTPWRKGVRVYRAPPNLCTLNFFIFCYRQSQEIPLFSSRMYQQLLICWLPTYI